MPLLWWQLRSPSHLVSYILRKLRANMQYCIVTAGEQNTSRLRGRTLTSEPCTEKARWKTNKNQSLQGNTGSNLGKDRQLTDRCQHLWTHLNLTKDSLRDKSSIYSSTTEGITRHLLPGPQKAAYTSGSLGSNVEELGCHQQSDIKLHPGTEPQSLNTKLAWHGHGREVWTQESWPPTALATARLCSTDGFWHGYRLRKTHPPSGGCTLGI